MRFLHREVATVHAAALMLGTAGLASRAMGVLRDRLLAAAFGAGRELDIYYAAFQIPDFMAVLFLLGGASAAVVPVFQEYLAADREKARAFILMLARWFLCGSVAACAAAFFAAPYLLPLLTPGFSGEERHLAVTLTRVMLLSPILLGLSAIMSAVVQASQRFFAYAVAPLLYNLGIICGILFFAPRWGVPGLGAGVLLGALLHLMIQAAAAREILFTERKKSAAAVSDVAHGLRRVVLLSVPRVLALSLSQATAVVLLAIATTFAPGSVAVFMLAHNLFFVPVGVWGISFAVALFPRLTQSALQGSGARFAAELVAGARGILFWVIPAAMLAIVLRAHVVRAALGAGAFSWEDTRLTAAVLAALAVAIPAASLQTLFIRAFYALGNTRLPLVVSAVSSVWTVALALLFALLLGRQDGMAEILARVFRIADMPHREVLGLGIGFSSGLMVNTLALGWLLARSVERRFGVRIAGGEVWRMTAAAAIGGIAAYLVRVSFSETLPLITFARVLAQGAVAAGAGFGVYWAMLTWFGSEEVAILRRSAARRLFSVGILPKAWGDSTDI